MSQGGGQARTPLSAEFHAPMSSPQPASLDPALESLLAFWAEGGVDAMLLEAPLDRVAAGRIAAPAPPRKPLAAPSAPAPPGRPDLAAAPAQAQAAAAPAG